MAPQAPTRSYKRKKPRRKPKKNVPKTTAQINRAARKQQKRREAIAAAKEAHRQKTEERFAKGERPWKPCHLCREEGHWDRDCVKYGAWRAKMDAKRG